MKGDVGEVFCTQHLHTCKVVFQVQFGLQNKLFGAELGIMGNYMLSSFISAYETKQQRKLYTHALFSNAIDHSIRLNASEELTCNE